MNHNDINERIARLEGWTNDGGLYSPWKRGKHDIYWHGGPSYLTSGDLMVELMMKHIISVISFTDGTYGAAVRKPGTPGIKQASTPQEAVCLARLAMEDSDE